MKYEQNDQKQENYFTSCISNEKIESLLNEKRLLILNGNPGIGKTAHAKSYCSLIAQ